MKSLTFAAAVCLLLAGMMRSEAHASAPKPHFIYSNWLLPAGHGALSGVALRRVAVPMQTAAATSTPTTAPTATATTGPSYPDPVSILQKMFDVAGLLKSAHFVQTAHQDGTPTLDYKADGDAVCKGPAVKAKVTAKVSLPGTNQSQSKKFSVIQVKAKYFVKSKATKGKWAKSTASKSAVFGINVDNPLPCPDATSSTGSGSGSGSGSSGTSDQIKDLVNLGPETFNNVSVWHIHATDVQIDQSGASTEYPVDWYVDQTNSLPVGYVFSFDDAVNNVKGSFSEIMSKFGEKIKIKAPKVGATKP